MSETWNTDREEAQLAESGVEFRGAANDDQIPLDALLDEQWPAWRGLLTTAKHLPGYGRTRDDSHNTPATVNASPEALYAVDLAPFRAAIDANAPVIMTDHVRYPPLNPSGLPATRSSAILNDLLRIARAPNLATKLSQPLHNRH